jgi:Flp pilus assembly protein TadD
MRGDASVLNVEEMLYAATLTNNQNEKLRFYETTVAAFPSDIRAQNNLGCAFLSFAQFDYSNGPFGRARAIENNDIVKNNLGMLALAKGEYTNAEELFTSMSTATPESRWGLGVIAITKGQYDQAINYFGATPCVNNALALILRGDYNRAKTMLDGLQDSHNGKRDYLKAVVGARLADRTYMLNSLRAATATSAQWKDYAKTDLEFAKYFNDNDFISAIR